MIKGVDETGENEGSDKQSPTRSQVLMLAMTSHCQINGIKPVENEDEAIDYCLEHGLIDEGYLV